MASSPAMPSKINQAVSTSVVDEEEDDDSINGASTIDATQLFQKIKNRRTH